MRSNVRTIFTVTTLYWLSLWAFGALLSAGVALYGQPVLGSEYRAFDLLCAVAVHAAIGGALLLPLHFTLAILNRVSLLERRHRAPRVGGSVAVSAGVFSILLVALLSFWPGFWTIDSVNHWKESGELRFVNWHPFAYPLFIALLRSIRESFAAPAFVNIILVAIAYGYLYYVGRLLSVKRWVILLLIALPLLNPAILLFFLQVWKDVPFSVTVLLQSLIVVHLLTLQRARRSAPVVLLLSLVVVCALCLVLRHNGVLSVVGTFVAVGVFRLIGWRQFTLSVVALFLLHGAFTWAGERYLGVRPSPIKYVRYVYAISAWMAPEVPGLTAEDRALAATLQRTPGQSWGYNCFVGDFTIRDSGTGAYAFGADPTLYTALFRRMVSLDRFRLLRHYLCVSSVVWRFFTPPGAHTGKVHVYLSQGRLRYVEPNTFGLTEDSRIPALRDLLFAAFEWSNRTRLREALLWRPALHLYLLLFSVLLVIRGCVDPLTAQRPGLSSVAPAIPLLFQLPVALVIGSPDHRYFFPLIWGAIPVGVYLLALTHSWLDTGDEVTT